MRLERTVRGGASSGASRTWPVRPWRGVHAEPVAAPCVLVRELLGVVRLLLLFGWKSFDISASLTGVYSCAVFGTSSLQYSPPILAPRLFLFHSPFPFLVPPLWFRTHFCGAVPAGRALGDLPPSLGNACMCRSLVALRAVGTR